MADLLTRWAFVGLGIGLTMTLRLLASPWRLSTGVGGISDTASMESWVRRFRDLNWYMHFGLPLYMIHQFEEHGIDLFGRWYNFQPTLCETIGVKDLDKCPLTPLVVIFVNIGTVWISGYLARTNLLNFGLNYYGLVLSNAVVHILPFVLKGGEYNPGLLTALALFLPSSYMVFTLALKNKICGKSELVRATAIGFLGHVVIIISLLLTQAGVINEAVACFIQLLNVLPLAID